MCHIKEQHCGKTITKQLRAETEIDDIWLVPNIQETRLEQMIATFYDSVQDAVCSRFRFVQ